MKNAKVLVLVAVVIAAAGVFWAVGNVSSPDAPALGVLENESVVIYKDPNCGCCEVYASYLKGKGVDVTVNEVSDLSKVKEDFGVPPQLQSCHTMEVGGYVVEGHVPIEVVADLLTERPDIDGIALPGMPSGSPGMPGPKAGPFTIYTLGGELGDVYTRF